MSGDVSVGAGDAEREGAEAAAVREGAAGDADPVDEAADEPKLVIRRRGRRVTTEPVAGYTGEPPLERQQSSENDARLKGDVPPHWG